jgi:hypothetical protein
MHPYFAFPGLNKTFILSHRIANVLYQGHSVSYKGRTWCGYPQLSTCMSFTLNPIGHIIMCRPRKGEQAISARGFSPLKRSFNNMS